MPYTSTSVANINSCWQDEVKNKIYLKILRKYVINMMVQKNLLIIELKNYVFKIEYLLVRYVYGLKLTYCDIKSNFLLKVR